jgi:Fe-S cluster assembly protein SufB
MPNATDVGRGPTEAVVRTVSANSTEPSWMTDLRLKGLRLFEDMPLPAWGADLSGIDFDDIGYVTQPAGEQEATGAELHDAELHDTDARHEAEAQPEDEDTGDKIREDLRASGVVFVDADTGLREHPEIFRRYFGSVVPAGDNKFVALNTAVWSGGSFIYVPPGVHVEIPLQALFKIDTGRTGLFERTLIVVDEGADVHYIESFTAPSVPPVADSLHAAVVEVVVKKDARCRYTSTHWSRNVYNFVTKRAICHAGATMEWVDASFGSKVTMKYPVVWLLGEHARGESLSVDFAWAGQHQDVGATMVHAAGHTSSKIVSKSVVGGGGHISYRGLVQVNDGAHSSKSTMTCDALQVDPASRWETLPNFDVREQDAAVGHASAVSCVGADQLYYLMSRGMSRDAATAMVIKGFIESISHEFPMEYAPELDQVILDELQAGNPAD